MQRSAASKTSNPQLLRVNIQPRLVFETKRCRGTNWFKLKKKRKTVNNQTFACHGSTTFVLDHMKMGTRSKSTRVQNRSKSTQSNSRIAYRTRVKVRGNSNSEKNITKKINKIKSYRPRVRVSKKKLPTEGKGQG